MPDWPLLAITPTTVNGWLLMRMTWPTGSTSAPNNCSCTTEPSTATFDAVATSTGLKNAPCVVGHERISGRSTSVPWICVPQFMLPATTWPRVLTPGATYWTPGTSLNGQRVLRRQRAGVALAHADAALLEVAGAHHDHVGAGRLDLRLDRRLRAGAERHHRDHRGHADDHAEHGQRGAHLVARQRLERDAKHHQQRHDSASVHYAICAFAARRPPRSGRFASSSAAVRRLVTARSVYDDAVAERHDARAVFGDVRVRA